MANILRKKLVPSQERQKEEPFLNKEPKNGIGAGSELILKPPTDDEAQHVKSTVTFKELEIRPISEGKIFVQKDHSFVPVSQDIFFLSSTQNLLDVNPVSSSPETVASDYQKRFVPIATICHGLLAGISLWQSIMVFCQYSRFIFIY
jgi:Transmembrane protein 237